MTDWGRVESESRDFHRTLFGPKNHVPDKRFHIFSREVKKATDEVAVLPSEEDIEVIHLKDRVGAMHNFGSALVRFYLINKQLYIAHSNIESAKSNYVAGLDVSIYVTWTRELPDKEKVAFVNFQTHNVMRGRLVPRSIARVELLGALRYPSFYDESRRWLNVHVLVTGTFISTDFTVPPSVPVSNDDVILKWKECSVYTSKSLLAASSPMFESLFSTKKHHNCRLVDINPLCPYMNRNVFHTFVGLMYDAAEPINVNIINDLTPICQAIKFHEGVRACDKKIREFVKRDASESSIHVDLDFKSWSVNHGVSESFVRMLSDTTRAADISNLYKEAAQCSWSDKMVALLLEKALDCSDHTAPVHRLADNFMPHYDDDDVDDMYGDDEDDQDAESYPDYDDFDPYDY